MRRKLPGLIVNPGRREEAERFRTGHARVLAIMLAALVIGGLAGAFVIVWFVQMPIVALVFLMFEAVAILVFVRTQRRAAETANPDLVVASSRLKGIEVGTFASDEAIWQAATVMRAGAPGAREQAQALVAI